MEEAHGRRPEVGPGTGHPLCFKLGLEATDHSGDNEDEVLRPPKLWVPELTENGENVFAERLENTKFVEVWLDNQ